MKNRLMLAGIFCTVTFVACKRNITEIQDIAEIQNSDKAGLVNLGITATNPQLLVSEAANNEILIVNTSTGTNLWRWKGSSDPNITVADKTILSNPTDAKRVLNGKYILATFNSGTAPNNGGVALIDSATKHTVFYAKPGYQAHSAEILPDGNVVVASADGSGFITIYKMDRNHLPSTSYSHQYICKFVHALVWDKKRQRLYAGTINTIRSYKYDFNIDAPKLIEVESEKIVFPYANRNVHDLFPVYGEDALWMSAHDVYKVDMTTRTVTQLDTMAAVKCMSSGPSGYTTAVMQAANGGSYNNKIVELITRAVVFQRSGISMYKARWYVPTPFSYRMCKANPLDMNNDGKTDLATYNNAVGTTRWRVADNDAYRQPYGTTTSIPVPADYDGDGRTEEGYWEPADFRWHLAAVADITFGAAGDIPVPGDYNGDGKADPATWRPGNGNWYIYGQATVNYGLSGDIPAPGAFSGGSTLAAFFRPAGVNGATTNKFYMKGLTAIDFGTTAVSIPVVGDFNGDGKDDIALYDRSTGQWTIKSPTGYTLNIGANTIVTYASGDIPCSGDFLELGKAQPAVYRPGIGTLYIYNSGIITTKTIVYATGDKLLNLPYSIRNVFFP